MSKASLLTLRPWLLAAVLVTTGSGMGLSTRAEAQTLRPATPPPAQIARLRPISQSSADLPPGSRFRDCDRPVCPVMVVVPAREFLMGSPETEAGRDRDEGPQVLVQFGRRTFIIQEDEVSQADWNRCVEDGACRAVAFNGAGAGFEGDGSESLPVVNVSQSDAQVYINWMSRITGERYRLPNEAEWEYAARGGTTTPWATGDELRIDDANFAASGLGQPSSLRFPGNAFGLKNMHGNVWEWVSGCPFNRSPPYTSSCPDPAGRRIIRGGSFADDANALRSANRRAIYPEARLHNLGFRMARDDSGNLIDADRIELPR